MSDTIAQTVLIHVDGPGRAAFFGTLVSGLPPEAGLACNFVTESENAYQTLCEQGHTAYLLQGKPRTADANIKSLYAQSLCGVLGNINLRVAAGYKAELDDVVVKLAPDVIWCWNGTKFIDRCLKASGLPFKVLEVANIPGHFVVEDSGVNAESSTFHKLVENGAMVTAPENFDYEAWRASYVAGKEQQKTIPQASVAKTEAQDKLRHLLGLLRTTPRFVMFQIDRVLGYALRKPLDRLIARHEAAPESGSKVMFFPQQVSSDSQLIFNADYNNISALKLLLNEMSADTVLLSNLHPAEHRLSKKLTFLWMCLREKRLLPAAGGAWQHLKAADEVVTINSTVGLEAAILGKSCRFLGKSLFTRLNSDPEALKWFLAEHIMPNTDALESPVAPGLIKRLRANAVT
jgi:capsular polysaccharide export protein